MTDSYLEKLRRDLIAASRSSPSLADNASEKAGMPTIQNGIVWSGAKLPIKDPKTVGDTEMQRHRSLGL